MSSTSSSWVVAWVRDDGSWALVPDVMTQDEAIMKTRYFEEVLMTRSLATDLDSLFENLAQRQRTAA